MTTRVRPFASAARMVVSGPTLASWRRESSASVVFGRSSEILAGSSIVKVIGSGAAPLKRSRSSTCCPGKRLHVDGFQAQRILRVDGRRQETDREKPAEARELAEPLREVLATNGR